MPWLEQTMRWFGPRDAVSLAHIRQAGCSGVVSALHHVGPGEVWTAEEIGKRKAAIEEAGMRWSVVESVPVHEEIKRRVGGWETHLEHYCESIRNLGRAGVRTVCYNFMAVTDWTRTDLHMKMPSGALSLRFDMVDAACFDRFQVERPGAERDYTAEVLERAEARWRRMPEAEKDRLQRTILMGLPGTVKDLAIGEFRERLAQYDGLTADDLRESLRVFLERVIPIAAQEGVRLSIHPDDPPFPMFGLPRIAGSADDLRALLQLVDSHSNGLTFCTGSLGSSGSNDLPLMLREFGERVHFLHLRSVAREEDGSFFEDDHLAGSSDVVEVMQEAIALANRRGEAIPMRPDHGHLIEGDETSEAAYPGYSFVGRLKGLAELRGLEMGLRALTQ